MEFVESGGSLKVFTLDSRKPREFQVTVCGVTVCPFSRHKANQRPKCL